MADDGRRAAAAPATATTSTSTSVSEAYGAVSSYSFFSQMENEVLTRALTMSLFSSSSSRSSSSSSSSIISDLVLPQLPPNASPTSAAADQTASGSGRTAGRVSRRRPRGPPARRATTTYITTNPTDFRQMVQQATGATRVPDEAVTGTEANRRIRSEQPLFGGGARPPTLDTSAFAMHREGTSDVDDLAGGRGSTGSGRANSSQPRIELEPLPGFPNDWFMGR